MSTMSMLFSLSHGSLDVTKLSPVPQIQLLCNLGFPSRLGIAVNDPQRYWRGIHLTKPRNGARLALNVADSSE
jgi:hypothetical protein